MHVPLFAPLHLPPLSIRPFPSLPRIPSSCHLLLTQCPTRPPRAGTMSTLTRWPARSIATPMISSSPIGGHNMSSNLYAPRSEHPCPHFRSEPPRSLILAITASLSTCASHLRPWRRFTRCCAQEGCCFGIRPLSTSATESQTTSFASRRRVRAPSPSLPRCIVCL